MHAPIAQFLYIERYENNELFFFSNKERNASNIDNREIVSIKRPKRFDKPSCDHTFSLYWSVTFNHDESDLNVAL